MYGFPTQTAQETIDSLEMVRQMFEPGILQSGFLAPVCHDRPQPGGHVPRKIRRVRESDRRRQFANNDIVHIDPTGADHEKFSFGLKKSLLNYMHGIGWIIRCRNGSISKCRAPWSAKAILNRY
jgi:hypothetical protein